MRCMLFVAFVGLAACDTIMTRPEVASMETVVLGRNWTVNKVSEEPLTYSAIRDNNNLDPYGRPAARRTPQVVRAIRQATGCRVVGRSMRQDTMARFFAEVRCP